MYIVGYVDDDRNSYEDYVIRLKRRDIDLKYPDDCINMEQILNWILSNSIKCLIVDYKLNKKFKFLGTELVAYINIKIPDLPCLILTNYPEESIADNMVISNLIEDRDILSSDDIEGFVSKIKQAVNVFDNRLNNYIHEYKILYDKKNSSSISAMEEERFIELYKLLRSYGEVDELPTQMMNSELSQKIDEILGSINKLVSEAEKRG